MTTSASTETAIFGAGCFWGVERAFREVDGVVDVTCGYCGGTVDGPTYEEVCTGRTGHAEVVEVAYDPTRVSYEVLLAVFWSIHDPTTADRQGPDVGPQYRSVIFCHTREQGVAASASRNQVSSTGRFDEPVVTEVAPAPPFFRAEDYHQRYLEKRGGTCR